MVNKYKNTKIDKMINNELRSLLEKKLLFTMDPKPKFKSKIMRDNDIISFFVNPKITVFFMDKYHWLGTVIKLPLLSIIFNFLSDL